MLSGKKAVIFDMDGTLTDSMWIWPEVDRIFLKKYHLTPPPGFAKALEGKSYTETAQYFLDVFPELSCSLEDVQKEWIDMTLLQLLNMADAARMHGHPRSICHVEQLQQ